VGEGGNINICPG